MANGSSSPFSAPGSLLGYFYQIRYALLATLRAHAVTPAFMISFEMLDDVQFEPLAALGDPAELFQTKHHLNCEATLTSASPDLWHTIRIWSELIKSGQFIDGTVLNLVTTAVAPAKSIASLLGPKDRDVGAALTKMGEVCSTSTNEDNAPAYRAFLALDAGERQRLVHAIVILDKQPSIDDLDAELRKQVHWAAEAKHHGPFLQRLEGWWYRRAISQLSKGREARILSNELEEEMAELRESFKRDALPIDLDIVTLELDEGTRAAHATSNFVRQLELIKSGQGRITAAIGEYYRAFVQRSRWMRDDLVLVGELDRYESQLASEWKICFERIKDELGTDAAEEAKRKAAHRVLEWAETVIIPLRTVTTPFMTRGSLHMLADEVKVGWHPDFRDRLASLLVGSGGG
jgi:hypothetical protein